MNIQSGFDFFGNGNIGDDLMLGGFLDALEALGIKSYNIHGRSRVHPWTQRFRFPEICWTDELARPPFIWAGIGDTPFQLTWGDHFLRDFESKASEIAQADRRVLVCVGAESEVSPRAGEYGVVASWFDRISVRDKQSMDIVIRILGVPQERVIEASDLANVRLSTIAKRLLPRDSLYDLGVILATETFGQNDLVEIASYLSGYKGTAAMFAGDIRIMDHHEVKIHKDLVAAKLLPEIFPIVIPKYDSGSVEDLVDGLLGFRTVISARYHCLLAAAWMGRRVAAIGRSSKVRWLSKELGIPVCRLPFSSLDIDALERSAVVVPMEVLEEKVPMAIRGVEFALGV